MDKYKQKQIDRLVKIVGYPVTLTKEISKGRTEDYTQLNPLEANLLFVQLKELANKVRRQMAKKIIHGLCLCGMTTERGYPDYERINDFVKNIGSRNPKRKKNIHFLTHEETLAVLNQVQAMTRKELSKQ